jgi:hypothetical protein
MSKEKLTVYANANTRLPDSANRPQKQSKGDHVDFIPRQGVLRGKISSGARRSPNLLNDSILVPDEVDFSIPSEESLPAKRLFFRLPMERINWVTSSFLIGTLALTLTAVPVYLWFFGSSHALLHHADGLRV